MEGEGHMLPPEGGGDDLSFFLTRMCEYRVRKRTHFEGS